MNSFFASVEVREKPEPRGLPVVLGADPMRGKGRNRFSPPIIYLHARSGLLSQIQDKFSIGFKRILISIIP